LKATVNIGTKNNLVAQEKEVIKSLSGLNEINTSLEKTNIEKIPNQITLILSKGTITIQFEKTVDLEKQYKKLEDELIKIDPHISRLNHMIKDKSFINKAPEDVIIKTKEQLKNLENRKIRINDLITNIMI
jgi:valyl-tRNA synthetase